MKLTRSRTEYALAVTDGDLLAILAAEDPFKVNYRPGLYDVLAEIPGVDKVEYDGHFGSAIHLRIDADDDTPETHAKVIEAIAEHVQACRDAVEAHGQSKDAEAGDDPFPSP